MLYRSLAGSVSVSEIAFGTGDNAGGMVYGTESERRVLVETALELGITLFDTSPAYGAGVAESHLGLALRQTQARDVLVATKVKIMPPQFHRITASTTESIDASLRRLEREQVDFLLIHNPCRSQRENRQEMFVPLTACDILQEMLPALLQARAAGKVRFLGLACDTVEVSALRPVLQTGEFQVINAVYHLVNPSAAIPVKSSEAMENYNGLFAAAAEFGASVAVISPLAGGALTPGVLARGVDGLDTLSRGWFRHRLASSESPVDSARRFAFLERPGDQSLPEAAYRYILGNQQVGTVIGGFSVPSQIREAASASARGPLSPVDLAEIARLHGYAL